MSAHRASLLRALVLCVVLTLIASVVPGCGIKLRREEHSDVDTDTPAGLRSQQLIDMLNSDWPIGTENVGAFAAADRVEEFIDPMTKLWLDRPYKVSSVDLVDPYNATVHLIAPYGANMDIALRTDPDGSVDQLTPNQKAPHIAEWSDVDTALAKSGGRYSYRVSKIVDGQCQQVAGAHTSESLPLASVFKLYVLFAVGTAVNAGTLKWDDTLTVTDRDKVLGTSLTEPEGSKVTVRTAAQKMIAISDNMATDMLINRVGRQAIEKALVDAGHHDPGSMTPFPTMHELFSIGWGLPDVRQQWKDATTPQQRAEILADADARDYKGDEQRRTTPAAKYRVEWFGSAEDICRVHVALQKIATGPAAPIRDMLAAEPGIDLHSRNWRYIGAKGGNVPGDLTFSWYAVHGDHQPYVVSIQLSWDRAFGPCAGGWAIGLAKGIFTKLD